MCVMPMLTTGCDESDVVEASKKPVIPYDPSTPVTVKDFSPKEGSVRTQILISGSNFGTDVSMITVMLDDVPLNVVSSLGDMIYVTVPQAEPSNMESALTVKIGKDQNVQEVVTAEKFHYVIQPYVSTLAGFLNPRDQSTSSHDGEIMLPSDPDFDTEVGAQFDQPMWLAFDQHKNLYVLEEHKALRFIDKDHTYVRTKFSNSNLGRLRTISFSNDWNTLLVACDNGNWWDTGTAKATAENGFTSWSVAINSKQCNGGAHHPQDDIYFYNSYEDGIVFKWNGSSDPLDGRQNSKELFKIQDRSWEFNIQFHPSGDFAYIVVINQHYILKSYYNREKQELEAPVLFAGYPRASGYTDGVATAARFREPYQGAFDEEGNFYVCDRNNHCIRKITPLGIVSTFAGRTQEGYADGPVRDAQFKNPNGIVYDQDNKLFYVADRSNHRIRMIHMPK